MFENKISVTSIIEKLNNGETLDTCGIECITYLNIVDKQAICNTIVLNSIDEIQGLKIINPISSRMALDMILIDAYTNIDGDYDLMCQYGIVDYIKGKLVDEYNYLSMVTYEMMQNEIEIHNSLSGVINRQLTNLVNKIPDSKQINKLIPKLSKELSKISPETMNILKDLNSNIK